MEFVYEVKRLVHSPKIRDFCSLPYPNHPKGCPMLGKKETCPPNAPYITEFFDLNKSIYIVHSYFNLDLHARRMKRKHPHWTERQARCVLYWQGKSRKHLKGRTSLAMEEYNCDNFTLCPEAMGVNVFVTCKLSGLKLDKTKNISICRHIALIGSKP